MKKYDYAIIGMGIGGLAAGALLANAGKKVIIFEKHSLPGGYGHTFKIKGFSFCPGWHYVWDCGKGQAVYEFLKKLGLEQKITFQQLDPQGFDRILSKGVDYKIGNGFGRERERLSKMFPGTEKSLKKYFSILSAIHRETQKIPIHINQLKAELHPWRYWHLLRYHQWTLQDLFNQFNFPPALQLVLAGQSSVFFLPPNQLSLIAHAGGVGNYNAGAYYPIQDFETVVKGLLKKIVEQKDCEAHLMSEVAKINVSEDGKRIASLETKKGEMIAADHFIFNADPQTSVKLIGEKHFPKSFREKLNYPYSTGALSLFLGIKGLDLEKYIGKENLFYYSDCDINGIYAEHFKKGIPKNKFQFFANAPSLRSKTVAPEGCHQIVAVAPCRYDYFAELKAKDKKLYNEAKEKYADKMIGVLEKWIPGLKSHIVLKITGSPTTSEYFVAAPQGNCYGTPLDPAHFNFDRLQYRSPFKNMFYIGASSYAPGFATLIHFASLLCEKLIGKRT
ncbi:MAG: NAD(P)/FAD-dependent oxidoreductase [Candidatus Peregrinibacteria bacterium]